MLVCFYLIIYFNQITIILQAFDVNKVSRIINQRLIAFF
ncbi:hypothetical protein C942_01539 [Photobacterium marinum]|uniref:Uncharacterized protein n=1 Tax=Photobacterium marinum TaxID=1056511 RepID=L8JJE7_9GAMM|nr:hypothetical protein C942_01539 [Photobacterium marinum]